eukprot:COSAG06_NODE_63_length_26848_cov_29.983476_24_plen_88_part_00
MRAGCHKAISPRVCQRTSTLRGAIMCEPAVSFLADWLTGHDRDLSGARIDAGDDGPPSAASTLLLITGQRGRVAMLLARMAVAISQP